jgi:DNA-binding NarL/FixJ family response regulator
MQSIDIPPASDPEAAFASVVALRRLTNSLEQDAVIQAIADGWTWNDIAISLGVTRQAVHKRYSGLFNKKGK